MATTSKKAGRNSAARRAPEPLPPVPVRITADLIERVDAVKPQMIPREPYIRHLLDEILKQYEDDE